MKTPAQQGLAIMIHLLLICYFTCILVLLCNKKINNKSSQEQSPGQRPVPGLGPYVTCTTPAMSERLTNPQCPRRSEAGSTNLLKFQFFTEIFANSNIFYGKYD